MNTKSIWVVVADEAIARFLRWPDRGDELEPVEELTDPAAHATGADLEDEQHLEAEAFARSVAQRLSEHLQAQRFDELRIAAAPRFLGRLRKALSPQVAARVRSEASKDFVHLSSREITERLFEDRLGVR